MGAVSCSCFLFPVSVSWYYSPERKLPPTPTHTVAPPLGCSSVFGRTRTRPTIYHNFPASRKLCRPSSNHMARWPSPPLCHCFEFKRVHTMAPSRTPTCFIAVQYGRFLDFNQLLPGLLGDVCTGWDDAAGLIYHALIMTRKQKSDGMRAMRCHTLLKPGWRYTLCVAASVHFNNSVWFKPSVELFWSSQWWKRGLLSSLFLLLTSQNSKCENEGTMEQRQTSEISKITVIYMSDSINVRFKVFFFANWLCTLTVWRCSFVARDQFSAQLLEWALGRQVGWEECSTPSYTDRGRCDVIYMLHKAKLVFPAVKKVELHKAPWSNNRCIKLIQDLLLILGFRLYNRTTSNPLSSSFGVGQRSGAGAPRTCWRSAFWRRSTKGTRRRVCPRPCRYMTSRMRMVVAAVATRRPSHGPNWIPVRPRSTSCPGSGRKSKSSGACQVDKTIVTELNSDFRIQLVHPFTYLYKQLSFILIISNV